MKILILDDEPSARSLMRFAIEDMLDIELLEAASLQEARAIISSIAIDIALIDIRLNRDDPGNREGLGLLEELVENTAVIPIVVSALSDADTIREAMRKGASDYLYKEELDEDLLHPRIERLRQRAELEREVRRRRAMAAKQPPTTDLIGSSAKMLGLRERIAKAAMHTLPALITGPTGAGKELVARELHKRGPLPEEPFMAVNCGAIPTEMLESQIFGHRKGAFTGAYEAHPGYLQAVGEGMLLLDEIGNMPSVLQVKLLRVLEDGTFTPLGSTHEQRFRGRFVFATNADLKKAVEDGTFRSDLYHRVNVLRLQVPPLDQRRDDIPALIEHFLATGPRPYGQQTRRSLSFEAEAIRALQVADWPGNVRELRNVISRMMIFVEHDVVDEATARSYIENSSQMSAENLADIAEAALSLSVTNTPEALECALYEAALRRTDGHNGKAAELLGVDRRVLERRANKYKLHRNRRRNKTLD